MTARPRFINGGIYHVYNRGVDKRTIFEDKKDHFRFIHDLYEFNDTAYVQNSTYYYTQTGMPPSGMQEKREERDRLVDVLAYALMPNHYHLLLQQRQDEGVSKYMKKIGGGYARYFNEKRERSGALFQGEYKLKPIEDDDAYLRHLLMYIHLNPVDVFYSGWKEDGLKSPEEAAQKLREYKWSSYSDYIGVKNAPSVLSLDVSKSLGLPTGEEHEKDIAEWLNDSEAVIDFEPN